MIRPGAVVAALVAALWIAIGIGVAAQAQTTATPNFDAWETVAAQAESTLSSASATDLQLQLLRSRLASWRDEFLNAQSANDPRIATLREQIAALGAAPKDGGTEPAEISARRTELNAQLDEYLSPKVKAEEAYNRADGLIGEVDTLLRDRNTRVLTELGPSPVNPVLWPAALSDLAAVSAKLWDEAKTATSRARGQNGVIAFVFFTIALALLLRGRRIMMRATQAMARNLAGAGRGVGVFLVSLGQVAVPILGIYALIEAVVRLDILGLNAAVLINALPIIGLAVFGGRWLGQQLFPFDPAVAAPIEFTDRTRTGGRTFLGILGFLYGLDILAQRVFEVGNFSAATRAVLSFPILVLGGVVLVRFGLLLLRDARQQVETEEGIRFVIRAAATVGQAAAVLGLAGVAAAAIGYLNIARLVVFSTALSLALIGLLSLLSLLARDLYAFVRRLDPDEASQSLVPVLVSLGLTVVALPLFAVIWGARWTEMGEIWARIREGFAIGGTRISPTDFLTFALVFAIGYGLTRVLQAMLRSAVLPRTSLDPGGQDAVTSGIGYVGIFLATVIAVTSAGIDLTSLALVAGALSVGIGFGLQTVVSNFVSGIILLIERPISQGDWIEVGGQMGIVKSISVRSTRIETFDRTDVIVPNADLVSGTVTNWTRGNLTGRVTLSVGVGYGSDSRRVEQILREICESHPLVTVDPEPKVFFRGFGADALDFSCFCVIRNVNYKLAVHSELNHLVHERFRDEGIEIPFAQRDLWLRNPEALAVHKPVPTAPDPTAPDPTAPGPTAPGPTAPGPTAPGPTARGMSLPTSPDPEHDAAFQDGIAPPDPETP